MKKVLVGMFALVACAGMAMAHNTTYSCSDSLSCGNNKCKKVDDTSPAKCQNCIIACDKLNEEEKKASNNRDYINAELLKQTQTLMQCNPTN